MNLPDLLGQGAPDVEVAALAFDNRIVVPGTLFFCVPGFTRDGHDFAADAIARGAVALVVARPLRLGVPEVLVEDVRAAMAVAAARFSGDPTAALPVVGVTGTSGKTTTTWLVRSLLEAAGRPCGLLGTVTSVVAGHAAPIARTTPEAIELQATFRAMLDGGDRACAMEVSSHALDLHRVDEVHFAVAAFTNLSQDHLDFHPDMEHYYRAKARLFESAPAAINVGDPYGRRLAGEAGGPVLTFARAGEDADVRPHAVEIGPGGVISLIATTPRGALPLDVRLRGGFNVENVLCAVALAEVLEVPHGAVRAGIAAVQGVPGRFEPVEAGQPFTVLVDYAHTPDGLENLLRSAREITAGRLICVFGCGGDRDRGKRPLMGSVVRRLADVGLVTSDNPRSEDPAAIIADITAGFDMDVEVDRRTAIARAVATAEPDDVVVIAGKGHEQGQELADRTIPFDDREVAREALTALAGAA
jgi:UDP-N-acetylmuramoyl-L-alanyl-D-glutamate--2,6-diaminopimelate ligase